MPRTLPAALTTAMDSGAYEPYIRVITANSPETTAETVTPLAYKLEPLKASVTIPYSEANDNSWFRIVRGAVINGTPSTISSIWFRTTDYLYNGKFVTLLGEPLERKYMSIAADSDYETVIETALTPSDVDPILPSYEGTAAWKAYQFYPTGSPIILSTISRLFSLLQQKYLIFATEDGFDGTNNNMFFFVATDTRATDYSITDQLFNYNSHSVTKRLMWKDEAGLVSTNGSATDTIHNLGFLHSTASAPTNAENFLVGARSSKVPVHLKYRTGDKADILMNANFHPGERRIRVTEVLDTNSVPAWYQIIEPLIWFSGTEGTPQPGLIAEGDALRSAGRYPLRDIPRLPGGGRTIVEQAAVTVEEVTYAPLHTGSFASKLSTNDNNIQQAFETLDRHTHTANPTTEEVQDIVGAMTTGNTETGIAVTYQDSDGTIDFVTDVTTSSIREKLTAARTYYIRTDGNDSNTGLANTAGGAFLTIQKAVDTIATLDINGQTTTVQIADGTYTGTVTLKNVTGFAIAGNLVIQGNNGAPANVHVNVTGTAFAASNLNVVWDIKDLKITCTNIALYALNSYMRFSNLDFAAATGAHIYGDAHGKIEATGNYAVSANSPYHWFSNAPDSFINAAGMTITFSNSPVFTTFAHCTILGALFIHAMTFTNGGTVTGKRYQSDGNSSIYTGGGGANYIPGNAAGSTATGGQYL